MFKLGRAYDLACSSKLRSETFSSFFILYNSLRDTHALVPFEVFGLTRLLLFEIDFFAVNCYFSCFTYQFWYQKNYGGQASIAL